MRITFFFPYYLVSGIPVLFSNVANYLLQHTEIEIYIVDYKDGALISLCNPHPNLHFIEFKDFEDCHVDFDTYLILQAGLPDKLRSELKIGKDVKIFQWAAFEYNLVPYLSRIGFIHNLQLGNLNFYRLFRWMDGGKAKILSDWTSRMIDRGAITFMTKIIFELTVKYLMLGPNLKVKYLPNLGNGITAYSEDLIEKKSSEVKQKLELAWIGRIADFKVHILNYSLKKLSEVALKQKIHIRFHIIGDGEFANILELDCINDFFEIVNLGKLEKSKVDIYLAEKIHALFAMGTSALDGARIGLPVVLLDQSYTKISKDYKFRYLQDTEGFDLGHPIVATDFEEGNNSLAIIVHELVNDYKQLSDSCLSYYNQNHTIESVAERLLQMLAVGTYYYHEIPPQLLKTSPMRRLYLWYVQYVKKGYYNPEKI